MIEWPSHVAFRASCLWVGPSSLGPGREAAAASLAQRLGRRDDDGEVQVARPDTCLFRPALRIFAFELHTPFPIKRSEEHTSELQSRPHLVCRLLLEKNNRDC